MHRAQRRDAVRQERFFFRRSIYPDDIFPHGHSHRTPTESRTQTPEGSDPPSPTSPHPPHSVLSEYKGNDGPGGTIPTQGTATYEERSEYNRSSGTHTPELGMENISLSSPGKLEPGARTHPNRDPPVSVAQSRCPSPAFPIFGAVEDEYEELSIAEIINGKGESFPGLLGVVNAYLNTLNVEVAAKKRIRTYLNLIKWRADGKLSIPGAFCWLAVLLSDITLLFFYL